MPGEWTAQLSDDLKGNETFTSFETLSDFAKAHLDTVGKVTELDGKAKTLEGEKADLEGRLANAIPRLGEKPTDEEITAFRQAMGIPETADDYEFPKNEGVEHDEKMIQWAREVFHTAGLSKEQGALISQAWDGFIKGMTEAEDTERKQAFTVAADALKAEWGAEYDGNLELMTRAYKYFEEKINGFKDFLEAESVDGVNLGNHPAMIRAFYVIGKAMGEDISPKATPKGGDDKKPLGMNYEGMDHFRD